ncbi:MAG: PAS domain-containing protein [bacterium]
MNNTNWQNEFPSSITVCDKEGIIIYMNKKALETFKDEGGERLIGSNVLDCHPEPSRSQVKSMLENGKPNSYTIQKKGKKKLIHQSPYFEDGKFAGLVEISIEIPETLNNFVRD